MTKSRNPAGSFDQRFSGSGNRMRLSTVKNFVLNFLTNDENGCLYVVVDKMNY